MISGKRLGLVGLGLALILLVTGCVSPMSEPRQFSDQEELAELPEGVTAQGVVLAAYLLSSGDIARAVEEALVSPEEVELARKAIAEKNLQEWVDRASRERK